MTKKLLTISLLFAIISCASSEVQKEQVKSAKSSAASERLNSGASNNKDIFKEMDETTKKAE